MIFRREAVQIDNEGGIWDESMGMYPAAGGRPIVGDHEWRFPWRTRISFRHLQHENDKLSWQGSQIPFLGFDELTHFTASQFWYMLSRNRSVCGVRPYVRGSTNPEPGWVKEFLAQWVDKTHPDPAASGELRWMVRHKGELVWAHDPATLRKRFPKLLPKSVTFVRASIWDNRIGMEKDPNYLGNLQALPPVEQARLLDGDWDVKRDGLCYPGLPDCVADFDPARLHGRKVGGIDFGWNDPFCALAAVLDDDVLWVYWEHYKSFMTVPQHAAVLPRDGTVWQADPGRPDSIAELCNGGHTVRSCPHLGNQPIVDGIDKVSERIRTGRLKIHRSCQQLLREAGMYVFGPNGKPVDSDNHAMDALRYLVVGTDRGRVVKRPPRPEPTEAQIAAEKAAKEEEARRKRDEWLRPDNPHWWGDDEE